MRWTSLRALLVALAVTTGTTLPAGAEGDLAAVPRISLAEFKKLQDQDKALVIDTRSAESYRGGHIPGAINVPLSAWNDHLPRLKATRKPIVAYCA
jgi:3-mercaptopyruvate sulfurtransferase SseA